MSVRKGLITLLLGCSLAGIAAATPLTLKGVDTLPGVILDVRGNWKLAASGLQGPHQAAYTIKNAELLNIKVDTERKSKDAKQCQTVLLAKTKSASPIEIGLLPGVLVREKQGFIIYVGTKDAVCTIRYLDLVHSEGTDYSAILKDVCAHFHWTR